MKTNVPITTFFILAGCTRHFCGAIIYTVMKCTFSMRGKRSRRGRGRGSRCDLSHHHIIRFLRSHTQRLPLLAFDHEFGDPGTQRQRTWIDWRLDDGATGMLEKTTTKESQIDTKWMHAKRKKKVISKDGVNENRKRRVQSSWEGIITMKIYKWKNETNTWQMKWI